MATRTTTPHAVGFAGAPGRLEGNVGGQPVRYGRAV